MYSFDDVVQIVSEVQCNPWQFRVNCIQCVREGALDYDQGYTCVDGSHSWYLQAYMWRVDTDSGLYGFGYGGKYFLSPHMTQGEIVKKCFVAARDFAEHEVREAFLWKGRRILGPHIDIEALWDVAGVLEVRDEHQAAVTS